MSRIGKQPIEVPNGTKVSLADGAFVAEGPKGKVSEPLHDGIGVEIDGSEVRVTRAGDHRDLRARHGLVRALLANAVTGASAGFEKVLEVHGVGYRAEVQGREVHFSLGYSHPVIYPLPEGIEVEIDKNNRITVRGCRRQQVGQVAAEIRSLRKPDPYKGKGIKYADEVLRRKVGKAGAGGAK
ncbi:MAG: 50S ribosomal protein L6 [Thermoanaerobaculia bacterium]|nr:50S ribosomal protein L6 [Thermoanaerobaculia bacterium]